MITGQNIFVDNNQQQKKKKTFYRLWIEYFLKLKLFTDQLLNNLFWPYLTNAVIAKCVKIQNYYFSAGEAAGEWMVIY